MSFHDARLRFLAQALGSQSCDALLVTKPQNVFYLTAGRFEAAYLLATPKKTILILPNEDCSQTAIIPSVEVQSAASDEAAVESLAKLLALQGVKTLGVEGHHLNLQQTAALAERLPRAKLHPCDSVVEGVRATKDLSEVESIRHAADVAARVWLMSTVMLAPADTEDGLEAAAHALAWRAGGRLANRRPVRLGVGTGFEAADPSPLVGEVSKLTFDVTAAGTYHSRLVRSMRSPFPAPTTRTSKGERVGRNFDAVFKAVCDAHDAAAASLRDGVSVAEVYGACLEVARKAGFANALSPALGHGVGLEPVEGPSITAAAGPILTSGMVVHVAPKITFSGWGGVSIGDDYVIRGGRATRLGTTGRVAPTAATR
ncbi:M24 family metallopeptidase [Limnoglobus roseus]|uniref:Aminopeptidase P family protein n=1 Tax=Limnoglobus roseus TaxID=2598579 RepID=A0A5C1AP16_9BACT|nr:M24 family metallopeptidase [Limnoglobus roseus]QEL20740.1 aminopeptidase P family protein [Limnoglobus roseus]